MRTFSNIELLDLTLNEKLLKEYCTASFGEENSAKLPHSSLCLVSFLMVRIISMTMLKPVSIRYLYRPLIHLQSREKYNSKVSTLNCFKKNLVLVCLHKDEMSLISKYNLLIAKSVRFVYIYG